MARPRFGPQGSVFDGTEPMVCPYCRSNALTVSMCGERIECLACGAKWQVPGLPSPQQIEMSFNVTRDPRESIEDPDDRPYVWDLQQEEQCP